MPSPSSNPEELGSETQPGELEPEPPESAPAPAAGAPKGLRDFATPAPLPEPAPNDFRGGARAADMDTGQQRTLAAAPDFISNGQPSTIVHCSDLHFGDGFQRDRIEKLSEYITSYRPAAVIVSGDLTMRARPGQFRGAREFLRGITVPILVIPGNHDIPLYNVPLRLVNPFATYNHFTRGFSQNPLTLPGVSFYGANTVNPLKHQQGRFREQDLEGIERWSRHLPPEHWRVVVGHQHFKDVPGHERPGAMVDAVGTLERLTAANVHAYLCGHVHFNYVTTTREFFAGLDAQMALVHAGTATSERLRGEVRVNNFNVIDFYPDRLVVRMCDWSDDHRAFAEVRTRTIERQELR